MKIAICDDDMKSRAEYLFLTQSVMKRKGVNFEAVEYENGNQLEFALDGEENPPDIIILDILMPGSTGIDISKRLRNKGFKGVIIFLSCSADYMMPAFDVGAFNYVMKTADVNKIDRFEKVMAQAAENIMLHKQKYILLNGINEHRNLAIDSIRYFESLKHVITVHYGPGDETFQFISSLSKVELALEGFGFIRPHRSYLVNGAAIQKFNFKCVKLDDGTELPVGRKRYPDLKEAMKSSATVSIEAGA